jgi:serine protease Do
MNDSRNTVQLAVALEHMTGSSRGSITWLSASTLDVTLDAGCLVHISETQAGERRKDLVARLHRVDDTYEIEASKDQMVWLNGDSVTTSRLKNGDTIEFGETGPLCRCRFFADHAPVHKSVSDILSDIGAYLRVSRQPPLRRAFRACGALVGRLSHETSLLFRFAVLAAIVGFGFLAFQQQQLNNLLRKDIESATAQLDSVATALINAQKEALRTSDLEALRENLEQRVTSNLSRLEQLELRSTASARVIAQSSASVVFIQGVYGFRERSGDRMLRQVVNEIGVPQISPRGRPLLSLEGDGPTVELQFTGTGFVAGDEGFLITNRHVALPWEQSAGVAGLTIERVEPVMIKFIGYLPGEVNAVTLSLVRASEHADLAVLRHDGESDAMLGLRLAEAPPNSGDEVIVMGYPTGLRSMLAQSGADFIEELQKTDNTGFWSVAARLADKGYIAPLASRGIIGQVTSSTIVYDAETTHGGSGGPVLDINGDVVAVNTAILPEYGGSNLGVPVAEVRALIREALVN